ncbi:excitatory amino acid transporter-like [Glandiceps talaboti]
MAKVNCSRGCWKKWAKENLLFIFTFVGVILGFTLVFIIKPFNPSANAIMWIGLPGELFMRGLYCMVIPVLTASVVTATASVHPKANGKMSAISFAYMIGVVFCGVVVGLSLTLSIKPGKIGTDDDSTDFTAAHYETQDVVADLLRNLVPNNIVKACFKTAYTSYKFDEDIRSVSTGTNDSLQLLNNSATPSSSPYDIDLNNEGATPAPVVVVTKMTKSLQYGDGTNLLGLLVFSVVFGIAISVIGEEARAMYDFMSSLRVISIRILSVYLWLLPIGTPSLILKSMLQVDNLIAVWKSLGLFSAAVIVGLLIHWFITLSLIYFITTRKNPYLYQLRCARAILMAMITKTNAANMPEIFRCVEINNGVNRRISNYVVSLNVGMKSDGSALFIISGALYLAQSVGMALNFGHILTMAIVAWVMGLCLPAVPSASLVSIVTVCNAVAIPTYNIGLLVSMEWLLDALRTAVNCVSHCSAAGIVDSIMGKDIEEPKANGTDIAVPVESGNTKEEGESFL